jgi:hypothetical protein
MLVSCIFASMICRQLDAAIASIGFCSKPSDLVLSISREVNNDDGMYHNSSSIVFNYEETFERIRMVTHCKNGHYPSDQPSHQSSSHCKNGHYKLYRVPSSLFTSQLLYSWD